MSELPVALSRDLAQLSERAMESMVQIQNGSEGAGAGTVWHPDGLILTNAHVVEGHRVSTSGALSVVLADGSRCAARVLATDQRLDLAALRVDASSLQPASFGDSRRIRAGELVVALGFPWGVHGGATAGVVIGTGANLPELASIRPTEWIASSLHLRPGHSGGPLLDSQGRLIGINTLMSGPDVGVAIPVHVAVAFLKQALGDQKTRRRQTKTVVV